MSPATHRRDDARATRLLRIDAADGTLVDGTIGAIETFLRAGDLLVVNDAATLPASLRGRTAQGVPIEVRLAGERDDGSWNAVLFGAGDWRTKTELRVAPPPVQIGDRLRFDGLTAVVFEVDRPSPRLVRLVFEAARDAVVAGLYRMGRPIQYSYLDRPQSLWDVQTAYAARPWSVEAPSAGFGMTFSLLTALKRRGVGLSRVTHAAGLSSTGDEVLDARLPLPERYEITAEAVGAIDAAKRQGGRIIALGTTVTRALEGAAASHAGRLVAGRGTTDLRLGATTKRAVVDGIVTGVHDAGSSHLALLESFAPRALLERALALSETYGYRSHEFGDTWLVLSAATGASVAA